LAVLINHVAVTKVSATAGSEKEKSDEYTESKLPLSLSHRDGRVDAAWLISHGHLTAGGPVNFRGYIAG
jgi:hypothetical protein